MLLKKHPSTEANGWFEKVHYLKIADFEGNHKLQENYIKKKCVSTFQITQFQSFA